MPFLAQLFLTLRIALLALFLAAAGVWLLTQGEETQGMLCLGLSVVILILSWWWTAYRRAQRLRELIDGTLPAAGYERMPPEAMAALARELPAALPDATATARLLEAWARPSGAVLLVWGRARLTGDSLTATLFAFARLPHEPPLWVMLRSRGLADAPATWLEAFRIIHASDRAWAKALPPEAEEPLRELFRLHVDWRGGRLGARLPPETPLERFDAGAFQDCVQAWERLAAALSG